MRVVVSASGSRRCAEVMAGRAVRARGGDRRRRPDRAAGIAFPAWHPTTGILIAEVALAAEPGWGVRRDACGIHSVSRSEDGGR
jgi:hypothetical protein